MKKKILVSGLISIVLVCCSIICLAASNENKITMKGLGNEITSSINETEKSIDNLVDMDTLDHADNTRNSDNMNDMGNDISNAAGNLGNGIENVANDLRRDAENTANKAISGVTGNYAAGETATTTDGTGMSTTTWVWIVLAVVAVIIIASVWYYASQRND